jgi:undecaprenyl-diphosphatase
MFAIFQAILLGVVEGFTEFLPISSTGHLILSEKLLHFKDSAKIFTVVIQLGAVLAVIWIRRDEIFGNLLGLFKGNKESFQFWLRIVVSVVPIGLLGVVLSKQIDRLDSLIVVAGGLLAGSALLYIADRSAVNRKNNSEVTLKKSMIIGICQCLAVVPGFSRSGATISAALLCGINRSKAATFSFYSAIPIMVLASGLKIIKDGSQISEIDGGYGALCIGFVVSFVVALLAVKWLTKYLAEHDFRPFIYYRIVLAGALIIVSFGAK